MESGTVREADSVWRRKGNFDAITSPIPAAMTQASTEACEMAVDPHCDPSVDQAEFSKAMRLQSSLKVGKWHGTELHIEGRLLINFGMFREMRHIVKAENVRVGAKRLAAEQ